MEISWIFLCSVLVTYREEWILVRLVRKICMCKRWQFIERVALFVCQLLNAFLMF